MKESITKFDLEAAFKALDEIDLPKAERGIRANRPALTEIFSRKSKFDALFEEYYDISNTEGLSDAQEARDAEVAKAKLARIEKIVDLDAESPDELLTSYVGKYIIQCPQCMTLFYKNQEDIEKSEEDPSTVNISEVCQHCGNDSGYTLIGKVGGADEEEPEPSEETEVSDESNVDLEDLDLEVTDDEDIEASEEESADDLDSDLEELDLEIEDDEADEEEKTEESFHQLGGDTLVESLNEDTDLEVSESEFEELVNSELKKPISDSEVEAMLASIDESVKVNNETLRYAVINPDGTYAGVPCTSEEEARELAAQKDGRIIVELVELKKNSVTLEEGDLKVFGKTLGKKIKQAAGNIKNKVSDAIDKFADSAKTRDEKAKFIVENALDGEEKKFESFVIIGFAEAYTNGKEITQAPNFDDEDLVVGEGQPVVKNTFKEAEDYAKGWSLKQGNGPAFVYLAKNENDEKASPICQYFKGELEKDQLETYFQAVKDDLKGRELTDPKEQESEKEPEPQDKPNNTEQTESLAEVANGLDTLSESTIEKLMSKSLKELYKNVDAFKLNECAFLNNILHVDGTVSFTSGNTRNITYSFTKASTTEDGKTRIRGLNEKLGLDKAFYITGRTDSKTKTFIVESFSHAKK